MSRSGPIHRMYMKSVVGRVASASICLRGIQRASVSASATPCSASSASTPSLIQPRCAELDGEADVARQLGQERRERGQLDRAEVGAELDEHGPELLAELARAIVELRATSSASRSRRSWVISCGSLSAKVKPAGVRSYQPRTVFAAGTA